MEKEIKIVVKEAKKLGVKIEEEPCNVAIGMSSLLATTTGCSSNALGKSSLLTTTGCSSNALGRSSRLKLKNL